MRNLECIIQIVDVNCEKRIHQRVHFVKKNSHNKVKLISKMRKVHRHIQYSKNGVLNNGQQEENFIEI